jgi:hypothetical protein
MTPCPRGCLYRSSSVVLRSFPLIDVVKAEVTRISRERTSARDCDAIVFLHGNMADSVTESPVVEAVEAIINETAKNATAKTPSTPEGMALAYSSLCIKAVVPIIIGAFRSVKYHKAQKVKLEVREINTFHKQPVDFPYVFAVCLPAW